MVGPLLAVVAVLLLVIIAQWLEIRLLISHVDDLERDESLGRVAGTTRRRRL